MTKRKPIPEEGLTLLRTIDRDLEEYVSLLRDALEWPDLDGPGTVAFDDVRQLLMRARKLIAAFQGLR